MAVMGFVEALLAGSRFDHSGRGRQMRDWVQRSAQAYLAGERIYSAPEIKASWAKSDGAKDGLAKRAVTST